MAIAVDDTAIQRAYPHDMLLQHRTETVSAHSNANVSFVLWSRFRFLDNASRLSAFLLYTLLSPFRLATWATLAISLPLHVFSCVLSSYDWLTPPPASRFPPFSQHAH